MNRRSFFALALAPIAASFGLRNNGESIKDFSECKILVNSKYGKWITTYHHTADLQDVKVMWFDEHGREVYPKT